MNQVQLSVNPYSSAKPQYPDLSWLYSSIKETGYTFITTCIKLVIAVPSRFSPLQLLKSLLIPLSRILLQKLTVTQLLKKLHTFYSRIEGSLPGSQEPITGP
jgi:hypothetical protein